MPSPTRTINLSPNDPDSSGAGAMLFQHFEEARKNKAEAAQLDVTEGIRAKYRAQENAQANVFNIGMERLRHELTRQRTDEQYARTQQAAQQGAGYLEQLIGQSVNQGVAQPGLTQTTPLPEGVAGPVKPSVLPISPGAVDIAKDTMGRNLEAHFRKLALTEGLDAEIAKKKVFEQMDLVDDHTANDARSLVKQLEELDAPEEVVLMANRFTQPGQGSKAGWMEFNNKVLPEMFKYQENSRLKMALAQEISRRALKVAEMRAAVARLTASAKIDNVQYQNLQRLHQELAREGKLTNDRIALAQEAAFLASPKQRAKMESQVRELQAQLTEIQTQQALVVDKMAGWQAPSQGPTVAPGGFSGLDPAAPKGKDPLNILPNRGAPAGRKGGATR